MSKVRSSTKAGIPYELEIDSCQVAGPSAIWRSLADVYVGASLLDGGVGPSATGYHCVGVYDETYTALSTQCQ